MTELKQSKELVFKCMKIILKSYESERVILAKNEEEALKSTLEKYDDYYEWLQDKI